MVAAAMAGNEGENIEDGLLPPVRREGGIR